MIDILEASADLLTEVGFSTSPISVGSRQALAFEDATVLGFLFAYGNTHELIEAWSNDTIHAITDYHFGLRRAAQKAWNTYFVLLAAGSADYAQVVALSAIEEDLSGTRKIARVGVAELADLRAALLPLLPLQSAPRLEAVDILSEIRQRATELPGRAIDAFLSKADEGVVIQILEETS
jgi:hypothetical protein